MSGASCTQGVGSRGPPILPLNRSYRVPNREYLGGSSGYLEGLATEISVCAVIRVFSDLDLFTPQIATGVSASHGPPCAGAILLILKTLHNLSIV